MDQIQRLLRYCLLAAGLFCFIVSLAAQTIQIDKNNKTIAITATDSADAEADTADITVGFPCFGVEQNQTFADASKTSNRIVQALLDAGIPRTQIRSDQQSLTQIDTADKLRYQQGLRFTFTQSWTVTTKAVGAANLLSLAISSGANNSGAIQWRLADDNKLEAEAARKALSHAQEIAERMANGLHASLGPLLYASNQQPQRGFLNGLLNTSSASLSSLVKQNFKPLAIVPDKVTRSATVYAVFSIE